MPPKYWDEAKFSEELTPYLSPKGKWELPREEGIKTFWEEERAG